MKSISVQYKIENDNIELKLDGNTFRGQDEVLLYKDVNLLDDVNWNKVGFCVDSFLTNEDNDKLIKGIEEQVKGLIIEAGGKLDNSFAMDKYHNYVNDEIHLRVAKLIKDGFHVDKFPLNYELVDNRVSEIIGKIVSGEAPHMDAYNYHLRIVRPHKFQDNNPPHRDVWLDRLRNAVNIYVPICGSSQSSSLPLVPGSHLANESVIERTRDGAKLNGTSYTVPCVISYNNESITLLRPEVKMNEVMVFSPYLVHGGAYNFQENITRISLEARFWKSSDKN
jgi:hypothetical protein